MASSLPTPSPPDAALPHGVLLRRLEMHRDDRGVFTELFRQSWVSTPQIQWNAVSSRANVLRGVHVHLRHHDYLTLLRGRAMIGLCDLRPGSPTHRLACSVELSESALSAIQIPPGVAHGFYFHEPSLHVYAVSEYWDPADELGCHFADPDLGFTWPTTTPDLSPRDAALGPLIALAARIPAWQPPGQSPPPPVSAEADRASSR